VGESRGAYRVVVGRPEGWNHLENPGIDGRIILKWILEEWEGGMDYIDLAQDRDRWSAVVNAVMNFRVSKNLGNFLTSFEPVGFSGRPLLHGVRLRLEDNIKMGIL
jgi:hypothetical protein